MRKNKKRSVVIATVKSWNIDKARELKRRFRNLWDIRIVQHKSGLLPEQIAAISPAYIFCPHWSWIIPESIYSRFECVVFHMTDLPFGRGGTPLQNLIARGVKKTCITALKAERGLDSGPIYFKRPLDISRGSANDILVRAADVIFDDMIPKFLSGRVLPPKPQSGHAVVFSRRKPQDSDISRSVFKTERDLYDFVRMLDGEGYPPAFIDLGALKMEFKCACLKGKKVFGTFEVKKNERE